MATGNQDRVLKKKLDKFLQELQHFGTVKGFRHFQCYLKSKEELMISVNNSPQGSNLFSCHMSTSSPQKTSLCPNERSSVSPCSSEVDQGGRRVEDVFLPPASPCEDGTPDADVTVLLVAGYARYSCPYVWVHSNHQRLLQLSNRVDAARDNPLKLVSTSSWKDGDVHVTDVVAEVVSLCTYPAAWNPFDIDLQHFRSLPQPDQFLSSAAMMACLQKIIIHTPEYKPYTAKVFDDLQHISQLHFTSLRKMAAAADIPILRPTSQQQHHQNEQQSSQHSQQHQQTTHSLRSRYPRVTASAPMPPLQPSAPPLNTFSRSEVIYGHGFDGGFPGGFNRSPAPSLI